MVSWVSVPDVVPPKASELASIESGAGTRYRLTSEDAEWAIRMAVYEGSNPSAVLWVLAQRWVLFGLQGKDFTKFASLLRQFSQPINPKWLRDGEFCKPGGKYYGEPPCSEDKLVRRARAQSEPLAATIARAPELAEAAVAWLRGEAPNPVPRATDFAQEPVAESFLERNPEAEAILREPAGACPSCNVMIVTADTRAWPVNYVWMRAPSGAIADARGVGRPVNRFAQGFAKGLSRWWKLG
jgi:hypothetical protein